MIKSEASNNKVINSRNKISKDNPSFPLSKEEEELLYLINKSNFVNKISLTNLKLLKYGDYSSLIKKNYFNNNNNQKLISQVGLIYNRICKQPQENKKTKKLYHDMLFHNSESNENYHLERNNKSVNNRIDKSQSSIKKRIIPKLFDLEDKINLLNKSRKEIFVNKNTNINSSHDNDDLKEKYIHDKNNSVDKNKKFFYIIKSHKNMNKKNKRNCLPPINRFRIKFNKFKLSVNNEIDYSDQKHEDMMKMYKEIEFKNKNKFIV